MRTYVRLLPLAPVFLLAGCVDFADFGDSEAFKEDFHHTYPLQAGGTVSVETFNGAIEVTGWEQDSVEVNGTKYASTKWALDAIKIDASTSPGSVHIRASRGSDFHRNGGARFTLRVPRRVTLDSITTSNGHLRIEDLDGTARLRTSNGGIRLSRVKGETEARTSNGTIEADYMEGDTRLHTSNGAIRAEVDRGLLEAITSNGSITARLRDPSSTWPIRAETSNGHIDLRIDSKQVPEVRASTNNSSIVVRLPGGANADVRAHTTHASVVSDFDEVRIENEHGRGEMSGRIGSGGRLIELSSSNGSIKILRL
jgi:DUF4097 and DUF4098 domain-containing protein YvlB